MYDYTEEQIEKRLQEYKCYLCRKGQTEEDLLFCHEDDHDAPHVPLYEILEELAEMEELDDKNYSRPFHEKCMNEAYDKEIPRLIDLIWKDKKIMEAYIQAKEIENKIELLMSFAFEEARIYSEDMEMDLITEIDARLNEKKS